MLATAFFWKKLALLWHIELGGLLIIAGLSVVTPVGWGLLVRSVLARYLKLDVATSSPNSTGWTLIALGILFIVCGEAWRKTQGNGGDRLLLFRHESFDRTMTRVLSTDLKLELSECAIQEIACDQKAFLEKRPLNLKLATSTQAKTLETLKILIAQNPSWQTGYYGIAHIPFVFAAGHALSSTADIHLFEHWPRIGKWKELDAVGTPLGFFVSENNTPPSFNSVVIRIAISFEININLVAQKLEEPFVDVLLTIPAPRREAVYAYDQVADCAARFRRLLDDWSGRLPLGGSIHVFYSGPVPLAFRLGQQISQSIHKPVFIYNYSSGRPTPYEWHLVVNKT